MGRTRWLIVLGTVVVVACAREPSMRERLVEQNAVEARFAAWVRVINNPAQDSLMRFYHQVPELRVVWPDGQRTVGWDETRQGWQEFYGHTDYMNFVVQSPTVQVLDSRVAVTTFRHSTDIVQSRRRQPVRAGYGTVLWVKDRSDDVWKIHLSHVTFEQQAAN